MSEKNALITGISDQDGAYLSQFLLAKGYRVFGVSKYSDRRRLFRLDYLNVYDSITIVDRDLSQASAVKELISNTAPNEIYNLAAISSVGYSFQYPSDTFNFNTLSVSNLIEAIKSLNKSIRFYQTNCNSILKSILDSTVL